MGLVYKFQQHLECSQCGYERDVEHWDKLYAVHEWTCPKCRRHNEVGAEEEHYVLRGTHWRIASGSPLAMILIHVPTMILGFLGIGTCLVYLLKFLLAGPVAAQQFIIDILQGSSSGYGETVIVFSMLYFIIRALEVFLFRKSQRKVLSAGGI